MSNKTKEYMIIYFSIYIVLAIIYGIAQRLLVCTDMDGFQCNFNENKLIAFLTVVAYILTPAVAIYGVSTWRDQHNALVDKEKFDSILSIMGVIKPIQDDFIDKMDNINYIFKIAEEGVDKYLDPTLWTDYQDAVQQLRVSFEELYQHNQDKKLEKLSRDYFTVFTAYQQEINALLYAIKYIKNPDERMAVVHGLISNVTSINTIIGKDYKFHEKIPFLNYEFEIRNYYNALHNYIIENKSKV